MASTIKKNQQSQAAVVDSTVQNVTYRNACAAVKLVASNGVLDLTEDDYEFLISDKMWIARDRARARHVVEAAIYGTLDYVGFPRFDVPAEFIAAAIAYYVHPINVMTASVIMEGAEFSENIINGIERSVRAREIFAHVIRLVAGDDVFLRNAEEAARKVQLMGV